MARGIAMASQWCLVGLAAFGAMARADEPPSVAASPTVEAPVVPSPVLPKVKMRSSDEVPAMSYYPPLARRQRAQGRVLAEFRLDETGHVVDGYLLKREPPGLFDATTAQWLRTIEFDVPAGWALAASPKFKVTFIYDICPFGDIEPFPEAPDRFLVTACITGERTVPTGTRTSESQSRQ